MLDVVGKLVFWALIRSANWVLVESLRISLCDKLDSLLYKRGEVLNLLLVC